MGNRTRCRRGEDARFECRERRECRERYWDDPRPSPRRDRPTVLTDGGRDAPDPPTRLYSRDAESAESDAEEEREEGPDAEVRDYVDFDPTAKVDHLFRLARLLVVVLVVGAAVAGALWVGPASGVFRDPGPTVTADLEALDTTRVERLVHEYTNRERREAGIAPLEYDEELAAIGEYHSRDMGTNEYVSHTSPDGETIADRYRRFDYGCDTRGEIIQWLDYDEVDWSGDAEEALAQTVVENWMDSDLHRSFVTNGSWSRHGVGVHVANSDRVYVTQNTCGGA